MSTATRLGLVALALACACAPADGAEPGTGAVSAESLARCLAERGAVYYGALGCTACRAQERAFGEAFARIERVECHPHAPDSQAERCVARGIRVTPTWLLEREGRELSRLEGAHGLKELAAFAECGTGAPAAPRR